MSENLKCSGFLLAWLLLPILDNTSHGAGKNSHKILDRRIRVNEEQARERIEELKGYYSHLAAYIAVNLFLFGLNMATSPGHLWFIYPLLGWGIGVAIHTAEVFWTGPDWESRKMEELTGYRNTRDELEKLSERTEALVTILSSVNWEKIDPELVETRTTLESAKQQLDQLREHGDPASQRDVTKQIEKLEEFVTSSKFDYYTLAANDNQDRPQQ